MQQLIFYFALSMYYHWAWEIEKIKINLNLNFKNPKHTKLLVKEEGNTYQSKLLEWLPLACNLVSAGIGSLSNCSLSNKNSSYSTSPHLPHRSGSCYQFDLAYMSALIITVKHLILKYYGFFFGINVKEIHSTEWNILHNTENRWPWCEVLSY